MANEIKGLVNVVDVAAPGYGWKDLIGQIVSARRQRNGTIFNPY